MLLAKAENLPHTPAAGVSGPPEMCRTTRAPAPYGVRRTHGARRSSRVRPVVTDSGRSSMFAGRAPIVLVLEFDQEPVVLVIAGMLHPDQGVAAADLVAFEEDLDFPPCSTGPWASDVAGRR